MEKNKEFDIFTSIETNLKKFEKEKALIYKHKNKYKSLSYKEFNKKATILAVHLKKQGIKPSDKVVVMIPISLSLYIVIFALIKLGAVIVFIDPWIGIKKIKESCSIFKPKGFIGNIKANTLRILLKTFRKIPVKMMISKTNAEFLETINKLNSKEKIKLKNPYKSNSLMFIRFTTGSTGKPKGVERTYGYTCNMVRAINDFFPIKKTDIDLTTFPLNIFYDLTMGATAVIPSVSYGRLKDFKAEDFIEQIDRCNVTTASGSPFFWKRIADECKEKNIKLKNLRFVFTGGGPTSLKLMKSMQKIFPNAEIKLTYGSTESFPISWIDTKEITSKLEKQTMEGKGICLGKTHKDIKIKIIKPTNKKIKINKEKDWEDIILKKHEIGEIIVTGRHVIKKYYEEKNILFEKNKIVDKKQNIWHRTGDAGYLDGKNRIWLVGRKTNIFNIKNKRMGPLMFEYIFDTIPDIEKTAVTKNKILKLIVQPKNKKILKDENKKKDIKDKIQKICKKNDLPIEKILFINKIPLDERHNTKIDYKKLKIS